MEVIMTTTIWGGLELRHLLALQAVAAAGSFGRAAEQLGYTQSAVSQQIAALEAIVGERLIERARGQASVTPTEAGRLLLGHTQAVLARLEAARADFAAFAEGGAGVLRVGTYQSVSTRILPAVMRQFAARWPRVEVQLTESDSDELLGLVERGELDLTFDTLPLPEGPFAALELLRDPYVLLVAGDSPLVRQGSSPSLSEIAALPLVGFRSCRHVEQSESLLRGFGPEPRVVFRSDDNGAVQGMVAAGLGVALVPALAVDRRDPGVVALDLGDAAPPRVLCLAWHRDRYMSPSARAFIELASQTCQQLAAAAGGAVA
jgi:DNA-binding transcriptional LysR family regulator